MGKCMCSYCGEQFEVKNSTHANYAPTHDYPKPCRSVCPGSGQRMYRWGDVTKPLGKDRDQPRKEQMTRSTHTHANLEVSLGTYDEVATKLKTAGYDHAFGKDGAIDMHGIALTKENLVPGEDDGQVRIRPTNGGHKVLLVVRNKQATEQVILYEPTAARKLAYDISVIAQQIDGGGKKGNLEVGENEKGDVVVNLPPEVIGHIDFTPAEARNLAMLLLKRARLMDPRTKRTLEEEVRDYINEMANPSPDVTIRSLCRAKMAQQVGMEDPNVTLRKWNEGNTKR